MTSWRKNKKITFGIAMIAAFNIKVVMTILMGSKFDPMLVGIHAALLTVGVALILFGWKEIS